MSCSASGAVIEAANTWRSADVPRVRRIRHRYGGEIIHHLRDHSERISYRTFLRAVGVEGKRTVEETIGQRIKEHFFYAFYRGRLPSEELVYYICWSGIEHILTFDGKLDVEYEWSQIPPKGERE